MHKACPYLFFAAACFACSLTSAAAAQTEHEKLTADILHKDRLFWNAYNICDTQRVSEFFTADVEFYHDKGGVTVGIDPLMENMKKNLCSGNGPRLRREAVAGTEKVFPLQKGNEVYGAILSGEHVFYVTEKGKSEHLDGRARYTHLWLKKDGNFSMARILSYDHGPASPEHKESEIKLSRAQLDKFVGAYRGPISGKTTIKREGELLLLQGDKIRSLLYPRNGNTFFTKERDLTFEFQEKDGKVSKMVVREKGSVAEEALVEP